MQEDIIYVLRSTRTPTLTDTEHCESYRIFVLPLLSIISLLPVLLSSPQNSFWFLFANSTKCRIPQFKHHSFYLRIVIKTYMLLIIRLFSLLFCVFNSWRVCAHLCDLVNNSSIFSLSPYRSLSLSLTLSKEKENFDT